MGADFLEVQLEEDGSGEGGYAREMSPAFIAAEMALFEAQAREVDIIITTALIPADPRRSSTEKTVELMRPGSVIVDLAAEAGGNCALTQPGSVINHKGVTIIGYVDMPSRLAPTASALYGNNLVHLLADMGGAKSWHRRSGRVVRGALILLAGKLMWPPPRPAAPRRDADEEAPAASPSSSAAVARPGSAGWRQVWRQGNRPQRPPHQCSHAGVYGLLATRRCLGSASVAPPAFLAHFTVFVLACFIGWRVVWNVTPALHAADERHQRHLRHHRSRRHAQDRALGPPVVIGLGWLGGPVFGDQHRRRLPGYAAHAGDVSEMSSLFAPAFLPLFSPGAEFGDREQRRLAA